MSGEMRQNVSKKEIKGGGKKNKREPAENVSAAFSWFLVVSSYCAASCFVVPGEAFHNLMCGALIFFLGMFGPEQVHLQIRKHSLKKERERRGGDGVRLQFIV